MFCNISASRVTYWKYCNVEVPMRCCRAGGVAPTRSHSYVRMYEGCQTCQDRQDVCGVWLPQREVPGWIEEGKPVQVDIWQLLEVRQERVDEIVDACMRSVMQRGIPQDAVQRIEEAIKYRQLDQERQTSRHRVYAGLFIERHQRLLLRPRILLILFV